MHTFHRILLLALIVCVAQACHSPRRGYSSGTARGIIPYSGDPPVWIFIPLASLDPDGRRGFPAQIAVPPRREYTTNRIEVIVGGEVVSQGSVRLRPGSTVLQAINQAGGFTAFSYTRRLRIVKSSGLRLNLYRRSGAIPNREYVQVWYDTEENGHSVTDYVVEQGDEIHVGRAVLE
jgi:hypothetical protein